MDNEIIIANIDDVASDNTSVSENNDDIDDVNDHTNDLLAKYKTIQISGKYLDFLQKVAYFVGIFRVNPHLFVKHYLNINLKDFQKILLWEFVHNNYSLYIASRGSWASLYRNI